MLSEWQVTLSLTFITQIKLSLQERIKIMIGQTKESRKIELQDELVRQLQEKISSLEETIESLEQKNSELQLELEMKKNLRDEGFENMKVLMEEVEKSKFMYDNAVLKIMEAKTNYDKLAEELKETRIKYNKEMKEFFATVSGRVK